MTSLEQLSQQIKNILYQQRRLDSENRRLKEEINQLQEERTAQERKIALLTERLEKLLTL